MAEGKVWKTDDMGLASYLSLEGQDVKEMEWEMESCYFVFEDNEDIRVLTTKFVSGDACVEPRRYNMSFASLKKKMFSSKKSRPPR